MESKAVAGACTAVAVIALAAWVKRRRDQNPRRDGVPPPAWLFPGGMETHPQFFCYLITDPVRKHVVVLYHKHATRW